MTGSGGERRWTVAQIGAREHYAVPRALHRNGCLRRLYTDAYCPTVASAVLAHGPVFARSFAARRHPDLQREKVIAFTAAAVLDRLRRGIVARTRVDEYEGYVAEGRAFARRLLRALRSESLDPALDAFFVYDTGGLEALEWLRSIGVPTVVDQIDPGPHEEELVIAERTRWPGWEADTSRIPSCYWDRLRCEWASATRVVVNSEWSRKALIADGVPGEKVAVVPLAFELSQPSRGCEVASPRPRRGTLRVLWLGSVILRKGIPYLLEAARGLVDRDITFVVAGPVGISSSAIAGAPPNVHFVGRVPRDGAARRYSEADVFVLPTISDGFAITQLEALANGLPVIASTNCADVVTPDVDGLVVPAGDAEALRAAIVRLDEDRDLLAAMSIAARRSAARYSIDRLAEALANVLAPGPGRKADSP